MDLLSLIDKEELTRVGEALSSIDEQSLLDECLTIALSAECTKAAESYWWRSGFNRACDTVLGVLSICSCAGSLAAKLLPADTTALAEWKHVLLPLSVVSLTVWYLGDWRTAAKKQLELHNKLRVLARRAKNIEVDLDNTDGISRDATSCAMSSPLQLTLKVLCDCGRCSTAEARQKEWDSIVRERTNLEGAATAPPCPWSHHPSSPEKNGILAQLVQWAPWIVVGAAAVAVGTLRYLK